MLGSNSHRVLPRRTCCRYFLKVPHGCGVVCLTVGRSFPRPKLLQVYNSSQSTEGARDPQGEIIPTHISTSRRGTCRFPEAPPMLVRKNGFVCVSSHYVSYRRGRGRSTEQEGIQDYGGQIEFNIGFGWSHWELIFLRNPWPVSERGSEIDRERV